jgi:hypothetical protein
MTPRQAQTALARTYAHAGFAPQGCLLLHRGPALVHAVQLHGLPRSPGLAHLTQRVHVLTDGADPPEIFEEYAGLTADIYSYESAYPNTWHLDRLNLEHALHQSRELLRAFQTPHDVAHFWQDRPRPPSPQAHAASGANGHTPANSLSQAQTSQALKDLSRRVLGAHFLPAPRLGADIWVSQQAVGGFHHAAYLQANDCATFAHLLCFTVSAPDLSRGTRDTTVHARMLRASKHILTQAGDTAPSGQMPVLLPMLDWASTDTEAMSHALRAMLNNTPPNLVRT